jgi:hypothetical protein
MRSEPLPACLPKSLLLGAILASAQLGLAAPPRITSTDQGSGARIVSEVQPGDPANQGFTGLLTRLDQGSLQVRTASGYTREIACDSQTQITRAGRPAKLSEAQIGDTVGVIFFQNTDRVISLSFTPKAVPIKETPEQIARKKAQGEANLLRYYQDLAEAGDSYGLYRLGLKYLKGEGVGKDRAVARCLFEKAAAKGYEDAKTELIKLTKTSSSSTESTSTQTNAPTETKQ